VPDLFDAYVKILHPAYAEEATCDGPVSRPVKWTKLSAWSRKPLNSSTCIDDLLSRADGLVWEERGSRPRQGRLDPEYLTRLAEILSRDTKTPQDLWLLVWAGYGSLKALRDEEVELQINSSWRGTGRSYLLFHGSIDDICALGGGVKGQGAGVPPSGDFPNFWWPGDRSWFVTTDIDSFSTYVGGSASLVERLSGDDLLETATASLDDLYDPCSDDQRSG
jgi:hypothetical protein